VALYDVDSRIPNLALMKLSAWHKSRGWNVRLARHSGEVIQADAHFAATIFYRSSSRRRVAALREKLGASLVVGGTGWNLRTHLAAAVERMFPDYGYNTRLSQDYARMRMLRRFRLIPFFQEYWPLPGLRARLPDDFFDMDLREVIRLTFRGNGQNWEKYLRWLNRLYFQKHGRYYRPLVEIIYRYNNKERITRYLRRSHLLTTVLYRKWV
jgi:hypothetical protein